MKTSPSHQRIVEDLNPPQREAVLHEKGPLLVVAGAGSGKTRVITHRIAHLIHRGYPPDAILAITFTNKAADEMKSRTETLCGAGGSWISTFHSFCARILRRHIHHLSPYDNSFSIYDPDDVRSVLKAVLGELEVDASLWTPRAAQAEISRIKNSAQDSAPGAFVTGNLRRRILDEAYGLYCERMRERNAVDFDDLLLLTVRLFREAPQVLELYREQFQHVLIDEYQDINGVQYQIGKLLTSSHRNICITGDPDQSIYKWRGADIANILNFQNDYPDARLITLDRNYRSTQNILSVANALIENNVERLPKSLWTENPRGEPVRVYRFTDDRTEAQEVSELIQGFLKEGVPLGDIAIFYRINALSRPVEQEMVYAGIPYDIVGGIEFFLRKEVKDILAYLRIVDNPRDAESLKRIINVPPRNIGKSTVEKLEARARSSGKALLEIVLEDAGKLQLPKRTAASLAGFGHLYRRLAALKDGPVADVAREVIESTAYVEHLEDALGDSSRDAAANVSETVNAAQEYDDTHPDGDLRGFLEMVNLLGDVDRWRRSPDRVSLMSLHSAKGLEFPVVIIIGVEDGILPLVHSEDPGSDIEEERRLLYVGITRAQRHLYLSHAASRLRFGRVRESFPSRFLTEVRRKAEERRDLEADEETLQALDASPGGAGDPVTFEDRAGDETIYADAWGDEDPYPVGTRVYHDEYGEGDVVRITGIGRRRRITVAFDEAGEKQFVPGFTPLRRIR